LDMGGASLEIVFVPTTEILSNMFYIDLEIGPHWKEDSRMEVFAYAHSFLKYGQDQAHLRLLNRMIAKSNNATRLDHPCLPQGYGLNLTIGDALRVFQGTAASSSACRVLTTSLLNTDVECLAAPCSMNGVFTPPVEMMEGEFLATGAFFYILYDLKLVTWDGVFRGPLRQIEEAVNKYCELSWQEIETTYPSLSSKFLSTNCFNGNYLLSVLVDGFGFALTSEQIVFSRQLDGHSADWALGAMIFELNRLSFQRTHTLHSLRSDHRLDRCHPDDMGSGEGGGGPPMSFEQVSADIPIISEISGAVHTQDIVLILKFALIAVVVVLILVFITRSCMLSNKIIASRANQYDFHTSGRKTSRQPREYLYVL